MNDSSASASTGLTGAPFVGSNPSARAYLFTPATTVVVESGAWFTGAGIRDDFMRIELWSDDGSAAGSPADCLTQGTFTAPFTASHLWLGANFDTLVPLVAGTRYWVVFVDAGASLVPEEPAGITTSLRTRTSNNPWSTSARTAAPKFRLFCGPLDSAGSSSFGPACANSTLNCDPVNPAPRLGTAFVNGDVSAANASFAIEGSGFPGAAPVGLFIGFNSAIPSIPLGAGYPAGCALNTDVVVVINGMTGAAEIGDQPTSNRPVPFGYVRFPINLSSAMVGMYFAAQIAAIDLAGGAQVPIVTSNAVRCTIQ